MYNHPCHDMAKGEWLLKDVYVSLISCVAWNRTGLNPDVRCTEEDVNLIWLQYKLDQDMPFHA